MRRFASCTCPRGSRCTTTQQTRLCSRCTCQLDTGPPSLAHSSCLQGTARRLQTLCEQHTARRRHSGQSMWHWSVPAGCQRIREDTPPRCRCQGSNGQEGTRRDCCGTLAGRQCSAQGQPPAVPTTPTDSTLSRCRRATAQQCRCLGPTNNILQLALPHSAKLRYHMHFRRPHSPQKYPAKHSTQSLALLLPVSDWYLPARHATFMPLVQ
jgi:hypothetical protein